MDFIFELLSYFGAFSIFISLLTILLIWLFIRSAVASGTRRGIIDAYNQISGKSEQKALEDFEKEMKGWE